MDNNAQRGGREKSIAQMLRFDTSNPQQIAQVGLDLGYAAENVVNTLVERCSMDKSEAQRIVDAHLQGGRS